MKHVYRTWNCQNCEVQTSSEAFAKSHTTDPLFPQYHDHVMTETKWSEV